MNTLTTKAAEVDKILKLRAANTTSVAYNWARKDVIAECIANDIILHSFSEGLALPSSWTYEMKVAYIAKKELL